MTQSRSRGRRDAAERLRPLLRRAHALGAHLHIDMESMDSCDAVARTRAGRAELKTSFAAGPLGRAWCFRPTSATRRDIARAEYWAGLWKTERASPLTVRVVKARLLDHEVSKPASTVGVRPCSSRRQTRIATSSGSRAGCWRPVPPCASRSPRTTCAQSRTRLPATACLVATGRISELQVLRGLGDELQDALSAEGHRVRTYCPVGDLVAGMAYLGVALLANTANESFISERARGAPLGELAAMRLTRAAGVSPTSPPRAAPRIRARGVARRIGRARWPRVSVRERRLSSARSAATASSSVPRAPPITCASWPLARRGPRGRSRRRA